MKLNEFCDRVNQLDLSSHEGISEAETLLKALAKNKALLAQTAKLSLDPNNAEMNATPAYNQFGFILYDNQHFILRLLFWLPTGNSKAEKESFVYGLCHDHNFDLLTIGYLGSGYITDIWEYDRSSIKGEIGETIEMHHLDTVQLRESKSLYLRRNHHIHIQYPPSNISASISLIPKQTITKQAFIFDLDNKKVVDYSIKERFEGVKSMLIQFNKLL